MIRALPRAWRWSLAVVATVALAMGGLNLAFGTVPPEVRERMSARAARANLERIGAALLEYAECHGGGRRYPESLEALFATGILSDRGVLVCPSSRAAGLPEPHVEYVAGHALDAPCPVAFEHQAPLLVYQRGLPESYQGTRYAFGLRSDLALFSSREDLEVRAAVQRASMELPGRPGGQAKGAGLASADMGLRRRAAWRAGVPDESHGPEGSPTPLEPGVHAALEAALGTADPELALYAGLALAGAGERLGVLAALDGLEKRLQWTTGTTTWLVSGPRRRVLVQRLARQFPRTDPPFAYDPEPAQLAALAAWRAALEEGFR